MSRRNKYGCPQSNATSKVQPTIISYVTLSLEDFCLLKKSLNPFKKLLEASPATSPNRAFAKETVTELEKKILAIITNPVQWIQEMPIGENEMIILQTSLWLYAMQYLILAPACRSLRRKLQPTSELCRQIDFN